MKLWLDDYRDPVKLGLAGWIWVKTAQDAISYLKTGLVEEASLDHDLGLVNCGTGYDVILFLEENPYLWPVNGVLVHSRNPVAKKRMEMVINRHYV